MPLNLGTRSYFLIRYLHHGQYCPDPAAGAVGSHHPDADSCRGRPKSHVVFLLVKFLTESKARTPCLYGFWGRNIGSVWVTLFRGSELGSADAMHNSCTETKHEVSPSAEGPSFHSQFAFSIQWYGFLVFLLNISRPMHSNDDL
jgi:hypothetical protein